MKRTKIGKRLRRVLSCVYFLIGGLIGFGLSDLLMSTEWFLSLFGLTEFSLTVKSIISLVVGAILGIIFIIIIPKLVRAFDKLSKNLTHQLRNISVGQIVATIIAIILSLILSVLICGPIYKLALPQYILTIIVFAIYIAMAYTAFLLVTMKYPDIVQATKGYYYNMREPKDREDKFSSNKSYKKKNYVCPKVLDTSVIIDGRIYDIFATGFVEGPVVVPTFVIDELQFIADSSDDLKRVRGRRGLDILNKMQKELNLEVVISDKNYSDIDEVDSKLLKLAKDLKGKVVTNDYNLNKVAEVYGVEVLNTNELANSVKTVVIPGENMLVNVLKEGKEHNQGLGYLDDGTMIVVEEGRHLIGKTVNCIVSSVIQTAAGKMIFVKLPHNFNKSKN